MHKITLDILRAALALDSFDYADSHLAMAPSNRRPPEDGTTPREAGVLVLTFPAVDGLRVVLTRRTDTLRGHSGQVSFPGGRRDPTDPSFIATALRETCEEIGVCEDVLIIGQLSQIYIPPSNFMVTPVVGYTDHVPGFYPNPAEVAEVFVAPLGALLDPALKQLTYRDIPGGRVRVPYYALSGHQVWGATAIMLSEIEHRLRAVLKL